MRWLLALAAASLFCLPTLLWAQRLGVGYYDLEALYDTIPSPFYDDDKFTPSGSRGWNSERYSRQVANLAATIDSMALDVVGLCGVESEAVLRDLVKASDLDYSYIHRTSGAFDGLDFALLYFSDRLFIEQVESQRNMLIVHALLADLSPITIILTRHADDTRDHLEQELVPDRTLVVLGRLYERQVTALGLVNVLEQSEKSAVGNALGYRGWWLHDRIGVSGNVNFLNSGVYIAPWLLSAVDGAPAPTFDGASYVGGYSKYLPIFVYIL